MSDNKNEAPNIAKTILSMSSEGREYWDKMQNAIRVDCPVKKVNLSLEQPSALAALYLLATKDGPERIKEKAKMEDLCDNTILYFAPQHTIEIGNFLQALLVIAEAIDSMAVRSMDNSASRFIRIMNITPRFAEYLETIDAICNISYKHVEEGNIRMIKMVMARINLLMRHIPFITYADLDTFSQEAIDWFKQLDANDHQDIIRKMILELQKLRNEITEEAETFIPEKPPFEKFLKEAYDEIGKLDSRCAALKVENMDEYRKLFMDVAAAKNKIGFEGGRVIIDEDGTPEDKEKLQDELDKVLERCDNIHKAMAQRKELADAEEENE